MIIKNAIPKLYQQELLSILSSDTFPWFYNQNSKANTKDLEYETYKSDIPQFTHNLYNNDLNVNSDFFNKIYPLLYFFLQHTNLKYKGLFRVKANLLYNKNYTEKELKSAYHRDMGPYDLKNTSENYLTDNFVSFIYYVDDSDGDTILLDDDLNVAESITPEIGKIAWFKSNTIHSATPPTNTNRRIVINFIIETYGEKEYVLNEFLESIKAHTKSHKKGTLKDHLIRTYNILKNITGNETISLIGGLHSAYGTEFYTNQCLNFDDNLIKENFGEAVDKYVRMFCGIKRDLLENPDGSLSENDLFILRLVEFANLYDQDALQNKPNLIEFYKKIEHSVKDDLKNINFN
jgi:hypothetical protein